jgi:predicted ribosomally synthesized peptide with nif11-like leader
MSKESLEQFMEKVGSNEELRASVENQLDSDGNISVDALIALGSENGCEFTFEDLQQTAELSDEELDGVAGGVYEGGGGFNRKRGVGFTMQGNASVGLNFTITEVGQP